MPFTVTCSNEINQKLAQVWIDALDKSAVSRASNEIDRTLKGDPLSGVDRGGIYYFTSGPLSAAYTVSPDDRNLTILDYWLDE